MSNFLLSLALLPAETILNHLIAQDSYVSKSLTPFSGRVLAIESRTPAASLRVRFQGEHIRLSGLDSLAVHDAADATVTGNASDLLELLLNSQSAPLANKAISISGDAVFVQDLFTALRRLDVDWRDLLAPVLGDILTEEVSRFEQHAHNWRVTTQSSLHRSLDDYLKEEVRLVPASGEVARFSDQLDQLKLALDRVEARAAQLASRIDKSLKNQHLS